jgi:hypothetical protein
MLVPDFHNAVESRGHFAPGVRLRHHKSRRQAQFLSPCKLARVREIITRSVSQRRSEPV